MEEWVFEGEGGGRHILSESAFACFGLSFASPESQPGRAERAMDRVRMDGTPWGSPGTLAREAEILAALPH